MKPGDLIHTKSHAKEILPTVTLGGLGGPRVPNISGHIGTILQVSDWWGETWIQAIFPQGIGWVSSKWMEVLQ